MTTSSPHPPSIDMKRKQDDDEENKAHMHQQVSSTPVRQNKSEEIWELCLYGRLLVGLLNEHAHCQLSICARRFLDFRTHTINMHRPLRLSLLKAMKSGHFAELKDLITGEDYWDPVNQVKEMLPVIGPAFRGLKNLEILEIGIQYVSTLNMIFHEGLDLPGRARFESLTVYISTRCGGETEEGKHCTIEFKGFTNLSYLCLGMCKAPEMYPVLEALYQGELPVLRTLKIYSSDLRTEEVCRIVESVLHGNLQHVKSLDLCQNDIRDDAVDALIKVIPHLELLELGTNSISDVGVERLRLVAKQHPNVIIRGFSSQIEGGID